jgi:hypothetical protein
MLYDLRIQTWDDVLKDTTLLNLTPVLIQATKQVIAEFAQRNNLKWVSVPGQLFGGYYRNKEGTCWLLT